MMSDALAWALAYADRGLAILPVRPDKTPLTPHGLKDASRDPVAVESWDAAGPSPIGAGLCPRPWSQSTST